MKTLTHVTHGVPIEVAFYGAGPDWVLRLSHGRLQPRGAVNDAFVPAPEIGFLWARRHQHLHEHAAEHLWLISGMVLKANFPRPQDVSEFLDAVLLPLLGEDESLHTRVCRVTSLARDDFCASMEE